MPKQSFGALSWYVLAQALLCLQISHRQAAGLLVQRAIVLALKASQGSKRVKELEFARQLLCYAGIVRV